MTFQQLSSSAARVLSDHTPAILTGVGVVGSVTSAILAGKASFAAADVLLTEGHRRARDAQGDPELIEPLTTKEKVDLTWKLYLPAAGTLALTISSVVFAQKIGMRRSAALAAAYGLSEKAFAEYKDKVLEKMGENKERAVRDEVNQNRVSKNPPSEAQISLASGGQVLCLEKKSMRYFHSTMEDIKAAQNNLNYQVNNSFFASLNDFYDVLGLDRTDLGDEFGWNSDRLLEINITTAMAAGGVPCLVLEYQVDPIRGYARVH